MMDNLFAKIGAIDVTSKALPENDQQALDGLTESFNDQVADLLDAKTTLETLETESEWLRTQRGNLLTKLEEDKAKARKEHVAAIVSYFNREHDLGLNIPYDFDQDLEPTPEGITKQVSDWVLSCLGGKTFMDVATDKLREEFQRTAWGVKRNRRHVTLQSFVYIEDDYSGGKRIGYHSSDKFLTLAKALTRFQYESTNPPYGLLRTVQDLAGYWNKPPFGEAIPTHLKRCPEFVIFKNGNVKVTFTDEESARAFTTFYDLKLTD